MFPIADLTAWRLGNGSGIVSAVVETLNGAREPQGPPRCDVLVPQNCTTPVSNYLWLTGITNNSTDKLTFTFTQSWMLSAVGLSGNVSPNVLEPAILSMHEITPTPDALVCLVAWPTPDLGSQFGSRKTISTAKHRGLDWSIGRVTRA